MPLEESEFSWAVPTKKKKGDVLDTVRGEPVTVRGEPVTVRGELVEP